MMKNLTNTVFRNTFTTIDLYSQQAVSKWETGATLPDVDILLIISWMCRVTINEILDSEEVFIDQLNNIERELVRMNKYLICPECKKSLSLRIQTSGSAIPLRDNSVCHSFFKRRLRKYAV
jgi:hypothetical protein